MINAKLSRRQALAAIGGTSLFILPDLQALAADKKRLFKIGACDWSLREREQLAALQVARDIGLDGVQVSFSDPGGEFDLRSADVRRQYVAKCRELDVKIASLAMGLLNQRPYASDPDSEKWVADCVEVMPKLNQSVVLLAFFGKGDIKGKPDAQKEVIRRLKKVAPQAEKAGAILGIESTLNADEHLRILDAVGSPAVQVYYDVANMTRAGYDIFKEIRQIGRDRICEVHAKEIGFLLGQGKVDFPKVKDTLDDIGWTGWLIIEGATIKGKSMAECYNHNQQYLRSVFPTAG